MLRRQDKEKIWKGTGYGWGWFEVHYGTDYNNRGSAVTTDQGNITKVNNSGGLETYSQSENYGFTLDGQGNHYYWTTDHRFQGHYAARTRAKWYYEDYHSYRQYHKHRIDANKLINITFIGYDEGIVNVQSSQSEVILDGTLSNLGGSTTIDAERISAQGSIRSNVIMSPSRRKMALAMCGSVTTDRSLTERPLD